MKAFLLAAGFGTRLKPLTDITPKCLVPIAGQPLLFWWFQLLERHGVTEVLINTHYLFGQVRQYINYYNKKGKLYVHEFYEPVLLGSGGTVAANKSFVSKEESFLICYADNLTDVNIGSMIEFHNSHDGILTMALFHANNPKQCGIAQVDKNRKIVEFIEKPQNPTSNLANAGIYAARKEIFDFFPNRKFIDFGNDILPQLAGHMYGWEIQDYLIDIGTLENYEKAKLDWSSKKIMYGVY
ncbi:nucleotidyltransferase family protein [Clostridium sp. YIM B02515]|uniref:Nucleotidyltransferase family protein n=1 Tax=Clostridium rhizosphaerae TaxID=2803861 RepID=A0ABS1T5R7_9CLOT|nr:nucleotidyltransferase family protein [Clostridium rhizosphaerae]MBL4934679.1 nucleotidyltransferase family protein [Clostridium rhizosphaerae]